MTEAAAWWVNGVADGDIIKCAQWVFVRIDRAKTCPISLNKAVTEGSGSSACRLTNERLLEAAEELMKRDLCAVDWELLRTKRKRGGGSGAARGVESACPFASQPPPRRSVQ